MSTTLRYWEYYNMQETFDKLYEGSKEGKCVAIRRGMQAPTKKVTELKGRRLLNA